MPAREATAAASAIIGMWILVAMFPRLVAEGGVMFLGGGVRFMATYFTPDTTVYLITLLLQCAAGFFLLAKPWFVASKVFPEADHIGNDAE